MRLLPNRYEHSALLRWQLAMLCLVACSPAQAFPQQQTTLQLKTSYAKFAGYKAIGSGDNGSERYLIEIHEPQRHAPNVRRLRCTDRTTVTFEGTTNQAAEGTALQASLLGAIPRGASVKVVYESAAETEPEAFEIHVLEARGRTNALLLFGIEFSKERDDFSKQDLILNFVTSQRSVTKLKEDDSSSQAITSYVAFGLRTIPVEQKAEGDAPSEQQAANGDDGGGAQNERDTFLASRKSLTLELGAFYAFDSRRDNDVVSHGPIIKGGFQSLVDSSDTPSAEANEIGNVPMFFAGGWRIQIARRAPADVNADINSFLDIVGGYYQNFSEGRRTRFVVSGMQRLFGNVFVGASANVGREGPDDLRFFVAATVDLATIGGIVPTF